MEDVQAFVDLVGSARPATDSQLERIRVASGKDAQLQKVIDFTSQGWPTRVEDVPLQIREFFYSRKHLSISNGLLTYDDRIVISAEMTGEILAGAHSHRSPGHNKVPRTCQPVRVVTGYFQRNQVKGGVVPVLSAKPTFSEERTTDDHSPTRQAMAEVVHRFVGASRSEIPSGN